MDRRNLIISMGASLSFGLSTGVMASEAPGKGLLSSLGVPHSVLPQPKMVGQGRLHVFMLPIFDATLYAPDGRYSFERPFALRLQYLRPVSGHDITVHTLREMRRQGFKDEQQLKLWSKAMDAIFPDMRAGQSLIGVRDKSAHTLFYMGGRDIGSIASPEFTPLFFNIWLGPKTSQPRLRLKLLGQI
jgi:hypothetical protein